MFPDSIVTLILEISKTPRERLRMKERDNVRDGMITKEMEKKKG